MDDNKNTSDNYVLPGLSVGVALAASDIIADASKNPSTEKGLLKNLGKYTGLLVLL